MAITETNTLQNHTGFLCAGDELRCGRCGQTGHVEKECLREPAKPSDLAESPRIRMGHPWTSH